MATLNKVVLIGNLTRDPEMRATPKGTPLCNMGFAVNRRFKDDTGAARDETTFVDIEAWGKQAELVSKYLKCGSPAFVEGRLKLDQWEDKQTGQKRSRMKVVMENVQFLGTGGAKVEESALAVAETLESAAPPPAAANRAPAPKRRRARDQAAEEAGEDIPF